MLGGQYNTIDIYDNGIVCQYTFCLIPLFFNKVINNINTLFYALYVKWYHAISPPDEEIDRSFETRSDLLFYMMV